jgi:mono/diheme cytochrome c family protein
MRRFAIALTMFVATFTAALARVPVRAQEPTRTVADGVYTDAQADRGAAAYDAACSNCHRADLGGNSGPALKEQRFARVYADKDLKTLFTKVATTMPRQAPGSLTEDAYLDIVAHMLKENGFRAGGEPLSVAALDTIRIVPGQRKPPPPVGEFSYVEVVGCLTAGPQHTWMLTQATEPVAVLPSAPSTSTPPASALPGGQTFHLVDAMAYAPEKHDGHTISVRGLLIKLPDEQRITISSFDVIAATCSP